jgi:hypothetical protein
VMPVSLTTSADVNSMLISLKKCFKHFLPEMFALFYGWNQECQPKVERSYAE